MFNGRNPSFQTASLGSLPSPRVKRTDLALSVLENEALSPKQLDSLREILARYQRPTAPCGKAGGELLENTAATRVGEQISKVQPGKRRLMIIAGGQSGVDRAALDSAASLTLPCRGWCPVQRWAEDGTISGMYPMQECDSRDPAVRTELNTIDSDATLVITKGRPTDGTPLTIERAEHHGKPTLVVKLGEAPDIEGFWRWIEKHNIRVLNVGGPRESFSPGEVYQESRTILDELLDPTTPRTDAETHPTLEFSGVRQRARYQFILAAAANGR